MITHEGPLSREERLKHAEILATAMGKYVHKAVMSFAGKKVKPGANVEVRNRIIRETSLGLEMGLREAIWVTVADNGVVIPRFDENKFYEAIDAKPERTGDQPADPTGIPA